MKSNKKILLSLFIVISSSFIGMIVGGLLTHATVAYSKDRYADLQMFTKVLNLIEQHYVDPVEIKKLIYGGIKGMLQSLDPHTNFLPPDIFKEFKVETSGEFGGLGIEISMQNDILTVMSPIEDTPAWKAGIKAGDKIVEIEGKSTKGLSLAEAVSKMRGKRGSKVTIGVWREGFEKPKKFTLERELIKIRSVKYTDMEDGIGYMRITSFIEHTSEDLSKAIEKHEKDHGKLKGLILDLRNNPGGLLDQAINVCNQFIDEGIIVSTNGRNEKNVTLAKKDGARTDFPIVVLVNDYSASASEIVAGALQDHKRAVIMGTRTFGKGSVQSVVELGDGAGLKMTVARYYTPSGRSIQAEGIQPDIVLDNVDNEAFQKAVIKRRTLHEADIEGHLVNENGKEKDKDKDDEEATDAFWKNAPEKDKEKKREEEDAKLSPRDRMFKRDYQVSEAYKHLKAWNVFKQLGMPDPSVLKQKADETKAAAAEKKAEKKAKAKPETKKPDGEKPADTKPGDKSTKPEAIKPDAVKPAKSDKGAVKAPVAPASSPAAKAVPAKKPVDSKAKESKEPSKLPDKKAN